MGHLEKIRKARAVLADAETTPRDVKKVIAAREHLKDITLDALADGVAPDQIGRR